MPWENPRRIGDTLNAPNASSNSRDAVFGFVRDHVTAGPSRHPRKYPTVSLERACDLARLTGSDRFRGLTQTTAPVEEYIRTRKL